MSSISNNNLSQEYYYQVAQNSATYAQSATSSANTTSGAASTSSVADIINVNAATPPATDPSNPATAASGAQHHRHGGHGAGGAGGLEKLMQTVQSALSSSTSSSSDPNQVITNALQQLFGGSGDGTSTDGTGQDSDSLIENASPLGTTGSTGSTSSTSSSGAASGSDSADGDSSVAGSDVNSDMQTLAQLLQNFGVSPQQFRSDVISALNGSGSSLNESMFQNFEPGSGVDAIA